MVEKRRLIIEEMERGQGSPVVLPYLVELEPPFKPFKHKLEKRSFIQNLFGRKIESRSVRAKINPFDPGFIWILPARDEKCALENAEQFLTSFPGVSPVFLEIACTGKQIGFQLTVDKAQTENIAAQIRAHFPGADAIVEEKDLLEGAKGQNLIARAYRLRSSHFFPLVQATGLDPYRALFGVFDNIGSGFAVFQVAFIPVRNSWKDNLYFASRSQYDPGQSPFADLPHLPKLADKKIAKPLFAVSIRTLAADFAVLEAMESFFNQFSTAENGIERVRGTYPPQSILNRSTFVNGAILNSEELASLVHLPSQELVSAMHNIKTARAAFPVPEEFTSNGPVLGTNVYRGIRKQVCHSRNLPNRHCYLAGKSGYGKSNLILQNVTQRIEAGDGVAVIDPHGSLVRQGILPRIPAKRKDDTIYFSAGDFGFPMAINPLAHSGSKLEKEHIRTDLLNFFEDLFEAPLGVNVQHTLNFLLVTLLSRQDSTLLDMERLMIDKGFRKEFLDGIEDERVLAFWELEFPSLERRGIATAITNKLSPLILPDSTIGPMLSNRENKIDFLEIMDRSKVFLCNLSHGDIGKRNSQLLGKLLVSKIQIAAMRREGACPDSYLFIDEFQHMACPSMADILSGARKFGLHLCLANQMIGDIPDYILRHVFNASTMIFFASDSPNDQLLMEKNLSRKFKAEEIGQLKRGETLVKMVGSAFNMVTEKVPEPPSINYEDEIIARSRARYTASEKSPPVRQNKPMQKSVTPKERIPSITVQEKAFLECAYNNPLLSVTSIYKKQELSAYMGDKIKSALKGKGFVHEITTHLGQGSRIAKFLLLTPSGFNAFGIEPGKEGKGGVQHRYWQSVIKSYAEGKGYRAAIEEPTLDGKETVDIGLERDGTRIAVEVSITTGIEHEAGNAAKCLNAGYGKVVALFLEEAKLEEFRSHIGKVLSEESRQKVLSGLAYDFCRFL
ncbi:MAG: hypothetical protein QY316_12885 [Thermodesulfobacteriota bacterium]|nr:MAG: hypothetical protein QY316_12885 [Thermodesulfobacteriota bacterium]